MGRGQTCSCMHMILQLFQKGVHVQVRPLSTAQWHSSVESSQSASQANRAYSCGSGGRGPPSMNPCVSVNHQFSATISKISPPPPPSPVESGNICSQGSKTFLRRIAWLESVCSTMEKPFQTHGICPKEPSFTPNG